MGKKDLIKEKIIELRDKGALHIIIGSFLMKFVSFFGSIIIVKVLTKSDYGILSYYENFVNYFLILVGLGMASGLLRHLVLLGNEGERKTLFIYALRNGTLWNIILCLLAFALLVFYPHPNKFANQEFVAFGLIICLPFIYVMNLGQATLRGEFDNKTYAVVAFVTTLLLLAFRVLGSILNGLNGYICFRLIAEVVSAVICIFIVYKRHFYKNKSVKLDAEFIRDYRTYSLQIMFTDGLWAIFMLNDLFLLGQLLGDELLIAEYKVAYVFPANLSVFIAAIGIFVSPYFTKNENNTKWVQKNFKMLMCITMLIVGIVALLCFVFAKPIILVLYGNEYEGAIQLMRILLIASFFNNGIRATIANVLSAMGQQKINLVIAVIGVMLQVLLDVILIPKLGSYGVAISSIIVFVVMGVSLLLFFYNKYYRGVKNNE